MAATGGRRRGGDAGGEADHDREAGGEEEAERRDAEAVGEGLGGHHSDPVAHRRPDEAAHERERDGLDQELTEDLGVGGPDRLPKPDLVGALADRDLHDREDSDPAYEEGDRGDRGEDDVPVDDELVDLLAAAEDLLAA